MIIINSKIKKYNKVSDELGKLGILNLKRKLNKSEIKEYCEYDGLTKMAFEIVLRDTNKKLDVIYKKFINKDKLKDEFSDFEEWFNSKIESFKKDLPKSEIVQQALLIAIQDSLKEMILKLLEVE